jgi:uncharacterized protein (TIGR04255 family)
VDLPEPSDFLKKRSAQTVREKALKLRNPPIIEAVLDIDCDLPPTMNLAALEPDARKIFVDQYPKYRQQFIQQAHIEHRPNEPPKTSMRQALQALQFFKDDSLQLVQVRANGFSFNRLAPYGSLDDYMLEIRRTWELFLGLAKPLQARKIDLRYINRMLLPLAAGRLELDDFLKFGPHLPDEEGMTFAGFLHQHSAIEIATGNLVNTVLTSQPVENNRVPLIFDIEALRNVNIEPSNWNEIAVVIASLRTLKNRVFADTLSERCLNLFQPLE